MATETGSFIGEVTLVDFFVFLFVVILTFAIGGMLNALIIRLLKEKTRPIVYKTLSKVAMYGTYAVGLYYAFGVVIKLNVPAGLAALGILGVATLFPLLPFLQNLAAGIILAFERPFREDDIVEVEGKICRVKDRMLRKTVLRSLDGRILIVPNLSFLTHTPVINYSQGEFIKVALPVEVSSASNKEKAKEIIEKTCYENPNILPNIPEKKMSRVSKILEIPKSFLKTKNNIKKFSPTVLTTSVSKDKISLEVWFWIWDVTMKEQITSSFYNRLLKEFKKAKIKLG